jgi:hypothetical protein
LHRNQQCHLMTTTSNAMKIPYQLLIAFVFGVILIGCCDYSVEPRYFPPSDAHITIWRFTDDQPAASALSVTATFHDKYVGRIWLNDDTIPMQVSTRDLLTVVNYSSLVTSGYRGSIEFNEEPLRIRVAGSSAFPYINSLVATPSTPTIFAPAVRDTIDNSGFILRWNALPADTTRIRIAGRIAVDTLVAGVDSLRLGREVFDRFAGSSSTELQLRLTRSLEVQKVHTDTSKLYVHFEAEIGRTVSYRP